MRKFFKVLGIIVAMLLVVVFGIAAYVKFALPNVGPAPDLKVERTPERIERGKYLATNVMSCIDCHSPRDWTKFGGPLIEDSLGAGSTLFDQRMGLPGSFHPKNLTPYHLGNWTDGELFRAITTGVSKDGRALFPIMPYSNFKNLDREDIYSVIAYIRTLRPVKNDVSPSEADFPMNFIINTIPSKPAFTKRPDESNTIEYGKYLVTSASCMDCHSKTDQGKLVPGMEFAGGVDFTMPFGTVYSANITPDETGIKNLTKEAFLARFKGYSDTGYHALTLKPTEFNTPMPWIVYAGMKDKDLSAIYDYLRTVKPVKNTVVKFAKR